MWAWLWTFSNRSSIPAISTRTCGTVKAGVCIFPPPGFLAQEPGGQQRQALVVVPALPRPDLIVRQAGLALGLLDALLYPVLRLVHPRHLFWRGASYLVAQQVVMLETAVGLLLPEDQQQLRHVGRLALCLGLHQRPGHLRQQRPLLAVAHLDRLPI